jgi:hypothetical protein
LIGGAKDRMAESGKMFSGYTCRCGVSKTFLPGKEKTCFACGSQVNQIIHDHNKVVRK